MSEQLGDYNDFFLAGAGVAGALIGLLFVVISVSQDRLRAGSDMTINRFRASAALTAFIDVLAIDSLGLVPDINLGKVTASVGTVGLLFLAGGALSLRRTRWSWSLIRDVGWLVGLAVVFALEIVAGVRWAHPLQHPQSLQLIAILTLGCGLIGIARAWELIGAPSVTLESEVVALGRSAVKRARDPREQVETERS